CPAASRTHRGVESMPSTQPVPSDRGHARTAAHRDDDAPAVPAGIAPAPAHPPPPWITPAGVATPAACRQTHHSCRYGHAATALADDPGTADARSPDAVDRRPASAAIAPAHRFSGSCDDPPTNAPGPIARDRLPVAPGQWCGAYGRPAAPVHRRNAVPDSADLPAISVMTSHAEPLDRTTPAWNFVRIVP